jgi:hypothetical protein
MNLEDMFINQCMLIALLFIHIRFGLVPRILIYIQECKESKISNVRDSNEDC